METPLFGSGIHRKPWLDAECRAMKKHVKEALRFCRAEGFSDYSKKLYFSAKNFLYKILKSKEKIYKQYRFESINNCKCPSQFWKAINASRPKMRSHPLIEINTWYDFLRECYPSSI